jgi:hypothetical protein
VDRNDSVSGTDLSVTARKARTVRFSPRTPLQVGLLSAAAYLATRLILLVLLPPRSEFSSWYYPQGWSIADALARSGDGSHYLLVAEEGYPAPDYPDLRLSCAGLDESDMGLFCPGGLETRHNNLAFPPLYPSIIRVLDGLGLPEVWAMLGVSLLGGVVAAALIGILGARLLSARAGILSAALWGVVPLSILQSMGRPESLFTAAAAGTLLLLDRRRLIWAAGLVAIAGTLRTQAVALVLALIWSAIRDVRSGRLGIRRALLAIAISASGLLLTFANAAVSTGRITGWFEVQAHWGSSNDWGRAKLAYVREALGNWALPNSLVAITGICAILLLIALTRIRGSAPAVVYSGMLILMIVAQGNYHEHTLRFLIPAFPLLLPLAKALARLPLAVSIAGIALGCWLSSLVTAWFLTQWGPF